METATDGVDNGIKATILAIRERLMAYYKSNCVQYVVPNANISATGYAIGGRHAEQHTARLKERQIFSIRGHVLCTVEHHPDKITLHLGTLDRSVTMREVRKGVEMFLPKYLRGVIVETDGAGNKLDWRLDRGLVMENVKEPQSLGIMEYIDSYGLVSSATSTVLSERLINEVYSAHIRRS